VREISRLEIEHRAVNAGKSLERTVREWRKKGDRLPYLARINKHLADSGLKTLEELAR
jgi:hypothetical protein